MITYDADADALYITKGRETRQPVTKTLDTGMGILVDLGDDGRALGVEILNPGRLAFFMADAVER